MPARAVHVGDSWTETGKLDMGQIGIAVTHSRYTYEGTEGNLARIKSVGMVTYEPPTEDKDTRLPFQTRQANIVSSEANGLIYFDRLRGQLVRSEQKVTLQGNLIVVIGEQETKVEMFQTQKTTVKVSANPRAK
jgi:hypothetical protein